MIFLEYLVAGLAGSTVLIFLAKFVMAKLLQRDCDYYKDAYEEDGGGDHV